jgi:hypothetical protein
VLAQTRTAGPRASEPPARRLIEATVGARVAALLLSPNPSTPTAIDGVIAFDGEQSCAAIDRRDRNATQAIAGFSERGTIAARPSRAGLRATRWGSTLCLRLPAWVWASRTCPVAR